MDLLVGYLLGSWIAGKNKDGLSDKDKSESWLIVLAFLLIPLVLFLINAFASDSSGGPIYFLLNAFIQTSAEILNGGELSTNNAPFSDFIHKAMRASLILTSWLMYISLGKSIFSSISKWRSEVNSSNE